MFGQLHPIRVNKQRSLTFNYQMGTQLAKFLKWIRDVKQVKFSGFGIKLSILNPFSQENETASVSSLIHRRRRPSGTLGINNIELDPHPITFIDATYPYFSGSGDKSHIVLDFGRTVFRSGTFYPYVDANIGTFSSVNQTVAIGEIVVEDFGAILLKSPSDGFFLFSANGRIDITERYSNLNPEVYSAAPGQDVVFSIKPGTSFSHLETYKPFLKGIRLACQASPTTLTVTLPSWFKGGRILFESTEWEDLFVSEKISLSY